MIDTALLKTTFDWHDIDVRSSSQISSKTTAAMSKLAAVPAADNKTPIVALTAQARAANKLISIVEISKRQLKLQDVKVFQYTALSSELMQVERRESQMFEELKDASDGELETMGMTEHKQRAVPVVTVYLSTQSVESLRAAYGEQIS